jgi:hypothetical protein
VNFVLVPRVPVAQLDERNKSFGSRSTAISTPREKVSWAIALPWLSYGEDGYVAASYSTSSRTRCGVLCGDQVRIEACEMGTCIKSFG